MANIDRYFCTGLSLSDAFKTTKEEQEITTAIMRNDLVYLDKFISKGGDVNCPAAGPRSLPKTPIITLAAQLGRTEFVEKLLRAGADPHLRTQLDAFCSAAYAGNTQTVVAMIQHGVDVKQNPEAIEKAVKISRHDTLKALIAAGADVKDSMIYLDPVDAGKRLETMRILLDAGADIDARDYEGCTALMRERDFNNIKYLVSRKANVNAVDFSGKTVLQHFMGLQTLTQAKKQEIVDCLTQHGVVVSGNLRPQPQPKPYRLKPVRNKIKRTKRP